MSSLWSWPYLSVLSAVTAVPLDLLFCYSTKAFYCLRNKLVLLLFLPHTIATLTLIFIDN